MIECALLLAALLHRDPNLVSEVYWMAGLDGVSVVECESQFNPRALRVEPRGHTSFGLWQIDNEWHEQYRGNLLLHIDKGAEILRDCAGRDLSTKVSHYNGGDFPGAYSIAWGKTVEKRRDSLALYLWRRMR
jgi:hypothetical protein